ncbi:MAG: YbaB/EbfC family nucleoid-associated protein [Trueperaceae bacterium]|nr:YbaB/EbfC family nucleoid-associated protein [Trueperaceae bacterium]
MNIQKLMKEAQKAQEKMSQAQERLAEMTVEGSAGGGLVTVTATGAGDVTKVHIDPSAIDPEDAELLEDLVAAAVADAQRKAKELQQEEMGGAMGDMGGLGGMGGMGGLPGQF